MTTIKLKNGSGAPAGGDLTQGEPALDLTNKRLYTEDSGGNVIEVGTNPGVDVTFADNRKAIFGAGSDLKIYHDGSDSYIDDTGTGRLRLRGAADIILAHPTNGETYATFSANGANTFYYDNSAKLATTSTGIDVTGTVTADDITLSDASTPTLTITDTTNTVTNIIKADNSVGTVGTSTAHDLYIQSNNTVRQRVRSNGDISFYNDAANSQDLYWDASESRLGLGTTSPDRQLSVNSFSGNGTVSINASTTGASTLYFADGNTGTSIYTGFIQYNHSTDTMQFATNGGTNRMSISSTGALNHYGDSINAQTSAAYYIRNRVNGGSLNLGVETTAGSLYYPVVMNGTSDILVFNNAEGEMARFDTAGQLILKANAGSPSHVFTYNENGGEIELLDENGAIGTLIDQASNNTRILELINGSNMQLGLGGSNTTGSILFMAAGNSEAARFDPSGNLLVGGDVTPASSQGNLALFNGVVPTGSVTDGIVLYAEDVSSSSELKVRDEAGNITTLSPHNFDLIPEGPSEDMAWAYFSEKDGKRINVDMLKAIRLLERISGEKLVFEN